MGSDQSTVSKHLAVLRAHGIVEDRREGTTVYYTLLTPCVLSFFSCASQVLEERRRWRVGFISGLCGGRPSEMAPLDAVQAATVKVGQDCGKVAE